MAIVQVSRITHRKGLSDDLPQLAGAELGWVIDQRRLYIGNGTLQEGAPIIGNTEILTEFSDILGGSTVYTYKGQAAGYTAITGPDGTSIERTLQAKFDDFASVRDFGAVGDGETDDTAAINRALFQLFCREVNPAVRRSLFFPAGVYVVTESILIPPYARLYGEGADSSVITLVPRDDLTVASYCAKTCDSDQQTGVNIGTNGAIAPYDIEIANMGFAVTEKTDIFLIDRCQEMFFDNVTFSGPLSVSEIDSLINLGEINLPANDISAVVTDSSTAYPVKHVTLNNAYFNGMTYGVTFNNFSNGISITNSRFDTLYRGAVIGETPVNGGPSGTRIIGSIFDNIGYEGVYIGSVSLNATAQNVFYDVANKFQGIGNPVAPVINITQLNNISVGDMFQRTDSDAGNYARVELNNTASIAFQNSQEIQAGTYHREAGGTATLSDAQVSPQTFLNVNADISPAFVLQYTIQRDTILRVGSITVTAIDTLATPSYSENYTENNNSGIVLSVSQSGSSILIQYQSSSTGFDSIINYSISRLI